MAQSHVVSATRADRRIPIRLELQVEGDDISGGHFRQTVTTVDVSRSGARLGPLRPVIPVNSLLEVQYGGATAQCRVVWLGKTAEDRGQIGIRCLDENSVPWSHLLSETASEPHATVDAGASDETWPVRDRRRAARYPCNILVKIRRETNAFATSARLTDLSLTGAYLETMSPFPVGTEVMLIMETALGEIPVSGVIRTLHPAMGNGVEFTQTSVESLNQLHSFLGTLGAPIEPPAEPRSKTAEVHGSEEARESAGERFDLNPQIDALIELLEQKKVLTRGELLLQLQRRRSR